MSKIKHLECPNCKTKDTYETEKRVCITAQPELKDKILTGSYFEWECPDCHKRFFIDDVFLYNDDAKKFMVYLVPGYSESILKVPTLLKTKKEYDTEQSVLRVTESFVDFVEKVRILEAGLDDRVIEALKVYSGITFKNSGNSIRNMLFEEINTEDNLRFAVFLEDNDVTIDIPIEAYEQAKRDSLKLFDEPEERAFLMIDQKWLTEQLGSVNT